MHLGLFGTSHMRCSRRLPSCTDPVERTDTPRVCFSTTCCNWCRCEQEAHKYEAVYDAGAFPPGIRGQVSGDAAASAGNERYASPTDDTYAPACDAAGGAAEDDNSSGATASTNNPVYADGPLTLQGAAIGTANVHHAKVTSTESLQPPVVQDDVYDVSVVYKRGGAAMADEQADGRANAYGKPRRFQNPHVPLSGPVHCTDGNLYNPPPAEKVEHAYAADNAFALGQTQRFAVGHDYTGNPVMNGAVAAVAHDYRTTAECVKAHAQPPRAAAPLAHEAEQGPTYAAWKGPSSSGAPAGTKADAEANFYYQPAVASFKGTTLRAAPVAAPGRSAGACALLLVVSLCTWNTLRSLLSSSVFGLFCIDHECKCTCARVWFARTCNYLMLTMHVNGFRGCAHAYVCAQPYVGKDKFGNLDIGKEYANARETMTDAVHGCVHVCAPWALHAVALSRPCAARPVLCCFSVHEVSRGTLLRDALMTHARRYGLLATPTATAALPAFNADVSALMLPARPWRVHRGMSHADAEALLLAHGAVAGCYLLHARSLGVYTMTICTRGGKKKGKAKFAHHVLESTHTGFVFNGNTMAKLCTTLGDAVQHLKDNASKVRQFLPRPAPKPSPPNARCDGAMQELSCRPSVGLETNECVSASGMCVRVCVRVCVCVCVCAVLYPCIAPAGKAESEARSDRHASRRR